MQSSSNQGNCYRIIEFFSGIGGWASALSNFQSSLEINIVAAFDINESANAAYKYNFCKQPTSILIQSLNVNVLEKLEANVWVMSPPCQPFTRNNITDIRDINDTRSDGFLHLIHILKDMHHPPQYIAIENVVGFENSECCTNFLTTLEEMGYKYLQFILCPKQLGIPNSRPRYYCIACLVSLKERIDSSNTIASATATTTSGATMNAKDNQQITGKEGCESSEQGRDQPPQSDRKSSVTSSRATILTQIPHVRGKPLQQLAKYLDISNDDDERLLVPHKLLQKQASQCFDVVGGQSTSSTCFTKSYSRFIRGTGSIIVLEHKQLSSSPSIEIVSTDTSTVNGRRVEGGIEEEDKKGGALDHGQEKEVAEIIEQREDEGEAEGEAEEKVDDMALPLRPQNGIIELRVGRGRCNDRDTRGEKRPRGVKRSMGMGMEQQDQQGGKDKNMKESLPTTATAAEANTVTAIDKEEIEYCAIHNATTNPSSRLIPPSNCSSSSGGITGSTAAPITGSNLTGGRYRYFSPEEMLRLLGFPVDDGFGFPSSYSKRQCYQLIGNSVSVTVLTELLNYMFFHFRN